MPKGISKNPQETKVKRTLAMAGRHTFPNTEFKKGYRMSESHRMKISISNKGKKRWLNCPHPKGMLGKKVSQTTKEKISSTLKGRLKSEETRIKLSLANKGKKLSKEHRKKLREFHIGRELSESHKKNIGFAIKNSVKYKESRNSLEYKNKVRQARLKQVLPLKNTSIEIKLQNWLREQNIEFETHYPILGQPDIFIKPNICIFADGCYWHKCKECGFGEGRERDVTVTQELQKQGYTVYRLWEHEINNMDRNGFILGNQLLQLSYGRKTN